jgi:hypothetical protein
MTDAPTRSSPWLWEELDPGLTFVPQIVSISAAQAKLWAEQQGGTGPLTPLLVPLMMGAFIRASGPRVPGNIHVSQTLDFTGAVPGLEEALQFDFSVTDRSEKRGRGWVTIAITAQSLASKTLLMTGSMVQIWAGRRSASLGSA